MFSTIEALRRRAGGKAIKWTLEGLAHSGSFHPRANPSRHGLERVNNISYGPGVHQHLDVWRPTDRGDGPLPVILYIHGGGFRILSKESHWIMALALARQGYVVFNIDYRLAPAHPFPAAVEDAARAWCWVHENAARFGGDPSRVTLGGESAGANLSATLTIACCYEREEPFSKEVFALGKVPEAVIAACGIFQVSEVQRFWQKYPKTPKFVRDRCEEVAEGYIGARDMQHRPGEHDLADPLVFFERGEQPERALPPFIIPVGTRDVLIDDAKRMKRALEQLDTRCEVPIYEGEIHAFHAFVWRENARKCWRDIYAFLDEHAPGAPKLNA